MIYLIQISLLTRRIIHLKLLYFRLPITYQPTWKRKGFTVLTLLYLSAAFDAIDHAALLKLLSFWFGISGIALDWIQTYVYDRGQTIKIGENISNSYTIKFGVLRFLRTFMGQVFIDFFGNSLCPLR